MNFDTALKLLIVAYGALLLLIGALIVIFLGIIVKLVRRLKIAITQAIESITRM